MTVTLEKVRKIFAKKFSLAEDAIVPGASLEGLGLDSLDAIEALFEIEDGFHIRIPQERGENDKNIATVQDILDLIDRLVAEQRADNPT